MNKSYRSNYLSKLSNLTGMCAAPVCTLFFALPAYSALSISGIGLSPTPDADPERDTTLVTSITAGGETYTDLIGASASAITGNSTDDRFWAKDGTDPGSDEAALSGLTLTDGVVNIKSLTLDLNATINDGDDAGFFWIDYGTEGPVNFQPLDSNGDLIGDWVASVSIGSIETQDFLLQREGGASDLTNGFGGVVFSLADFSGGTGTLTGVAGLLVTEPGSGNMDPAVFGTYGAVPEPSSFALLSGFLGLAWVMCRRRC